MLTDCCVQVLTSFASGRPTSLVVDSGGSGTTVAAVHDGLVLHKVRRALSPTPPGNTLLLARLGLPLPSLARLPGRCLV